MGRSNADERRGEDMKIPTYDCYPEYEKCICKLAWKYANQSRFDFDELLSEANQGFLHAVDTFDPDKGACFHTWLYHTVTGFLKNFINQKQDNDLEYFDIQAGDNPNPEQNAIFSEMLNSLSKEAKEVVGVVLSCPAEIVELVKTMSSNRQGHMHVYRSNIKAFFSNAGWGPTKINQAFSEIKSSLN